MLTTDQLYNYSHTIGMYALLGRGFNNPVDMAFGKEGLLYVLNRAGPEVSARLPYKRVTICTVDEPILSHRGRGGQCEITLRSGGAPCSPPTNSTITATP